MGEIRNAIAADVDATSLRRVAREIGLTPSGLTGFIQGATPYAKTLRMLRTWYRARPGARVEDRRAEAMDVLLRDLAPSVRPQVQAEIRAILAQAPESLLRLLPVENASAKLGQPPRTRRKPARQKGPTLEDARDAAAHLRMALRDLGNATAVRHHIHVALRSLGENPDEVTEV